MIEHRQSETMPPPRRGETIVQRGAAVLLLVYAGWLVDLQSPRISRHDGGYAEWNGLWLAVVYAATAAGVWIGHDRARRIGTVLAALPAAVIPMVVLAAPTMRPWLNWRGGLMVAAAGAAAFGLLWRTRPAPPPRNGRRAVPAVLTAFGIEVWILAVCGAAGRSMEPLLDVTRLPAMLVLRAMGYCCGWGVVVTDYPASRWGTIMLSGLPILAVANTVGLIPFVLPARGIRRRRSPSAAAPREIAA